MKWTPGWAAAAPPINFFNLKVVLKTVWWTEAWLLTMAEWATQDRKVPGSITTWIQLNYIIDDHIIKQNCARSEYQLQNHRPAVILCQVNL